MIHRDNPNIAKKYKSKRWQMLRQLKLNTNPLCERCLKKEYIMQPKLFIIKNI